MIEPFANGISAWLNDETTSSTLSKNRTRAGTEVNISLNSFPGKGENTRNRKEANQVLAKIIAAFDQAKVFLKPSFFNTRSLKPGSGYNSVSPQSACWVCTISW